MSYADLTTILPAAAAAVYLAAWLGLLAGRARTGMVLMASGWVANAGLVFCNWVVAGDPPLGNMYHVLCFLSLCFLPVYLVLVAREKIAWTGVYFAFVSSLPLIGAMFMEKDAGWRRMPALQSPWFVPHVVSYMIAYALAASAFVMTVVGAVRRWPLKRPGDHDYERAAYATLMLAFPLMTFGMLSGALWAEKAWGAYWRWDPKETWSLITWTLYIIYFHCRARPYLKRYATWAHVFAFLALLATFILVNLLPRMASVLHGYATAGRVPGVLVM